MHSRGLDKHHQGINVAVFEVGHGERTGKPPVISLISDFVAQMNTPIADLSPGGKLIWCLIISEGKE